MPRTIRCLLPTLLAGALTVSLVSASALPTFAQAAKPATKKVKSAKKKAKAAPTGRLSQRLRLGDGKQTWHPTRAQLGVTYAAGGSDATPFGQLKFVVNRAKTRAYFDGIAPYVRRAPKDARMVVADPKAGDEGNQEVAAQIVPGYSGAVLNVDAAVDLVQKSLEANPATIHLVLPLKTKPAAITAASLQGVNSRIGYFVTRFNPGDAGRTDTVRRAIKIIDGTVVPPGGIFSVDKVVGPRDPAHGFNGKGHVFIDGHLELQSGGGMCQVATTIFNAAMLADLKIVERHQHVRTVPYVDPGRDATIYHGQKDFKLQNNTGAPLYISYRTNRSHAIVSLFGKGTPGQRVKLVASHRRVGERHYTGTFNRVVYSPDGTVQKGQPFHSNYKWPASLDYSR